MKSYIAPHSLTISMQRAKFYLRFLFGYGIFFLPENSLSGWHNNNDLHRSSPFCKQCCYSYLRIKNLTIAQPPDT